jgi:hypothetical protein
MLSSILVLAVAMAAMGLLAYASVRWGVDSRPWSPDPRRPDSALSVH